MTRLAGCALALLGLAAPAGAEVVESSASHFVTRDSVTVRAAPKAAWLALIAPGDWWDDAHTWSGEAANMAITPQGGGCFCERIPEEDSASSVGLAGSAQHMTVVMAEPMKVLRMRGGLGPLQSEPVDGVLTVTLQPDKASGGTRIVWEYVVAGHMRFPIEAISKAVDGVMSLQLAHLATRLGRIGPVSRATPPPAADSAPATGDDDVGAALDAMGMTGKAKDD